jgi:hypothetical protein
MSSIITESTGVPSSHSTGIPNDTTFTVVSSTSTTINSFESPTVLDTCQIQQSSDQPIAIDQSQIEQQAVKSNDAWTSISDEAYTAVEVVLDRVDAIADELTEFTPATARRTSTELMASCLPKIQLKQGRYKQGKPIVDKPTSELTNEQTYSNSSCLSLSSSTSSATATSIATIRYVI